jgi:hypothetical protein
VVNQPWVTVASLITSANGRGGGGEPGAGAGAAAGGAAGRAAAVAVAAGFAVGEGALAIAGVDVVLAVVVAAAAAGLVAATLPTGAVAQPASESAMTLAVKVRFILDMVLLKKDFLQSLRTLRRPFNTQYLRRNMLVF